MPNSCDSHVAANSVSLVTTLSSLFIRGKVITASMTTLSSALFVLEREISFRCARGPTLEKIRLSMLPPQLFTPKRTGLATQFPPSTRSGIWIPLRYRSTPLGNGVRHFERKTLLERVLNFASKYPRVNRKLPCEHYPQYRGRKTRR